MKTYIKPILGALFGFIICLSLLHKCDHIPDVGKMIVEKDTITPKITANNSVIKSLNDSTPIYIAMIKKATDRKNYYKQLYKSVFDSIYSTSDSVCKNSLLVVQYNKLKQDSAYEARLIADSLLADNKQKQIDKYKENQTLYDVRHKTDSIKVSYLLNDSLPKAIKYYGKKRYWKGLRQGFAAGVIATEAINIGSKIKP